MALLIRCPVSDYVLMPVIRQHRVSKKILLQQSANVRLGRLCLRLTNAGNMTWTTKTVVVVRLTYKVNESGEAFNAEVATAEAHLCTSSALYNAHQHKHTHTGQSNFCSSPFTTKCCDFLVYIVYTGWLLSRPHEIPWLFQWGINILTGYPGNDSGNGVPGTKSHR